jgi:hypothetical protein
MNVPFFVAVAGRVRDLVSLIGKIVLSFITEGEAFQQHRGKLGQIECRVGASRKMPPSSSLVVLSGPPGWQQSWSTDKETSTLTGHHRFDLHAILARGLDRILFVERAKVDPLWKH